MFLGRFANATMTRALHRARWKIRSGGFPTVTDDTFLIRAMFNLLSHGFLNKYKLSYQSDRCKTQDGCVREVNLLLIKSVLLHFLPGNER